MRYSKLAVLAATLTTWLSGASLTTAADVWLKGMTLRAEDVGGYKYSPLPDVKIKAFRGGPILKMPESSGADGKFKFSVPEGAPFNVLFYLDQDTVPELQNLAGPPGIKHKFHVGLITVNEYLALQKQGKLPPLDKKLQGILAQLPEDEEVAGLIRQIMARAG